MNRPTVEMFPTAPTLNVFSTTRNLDDIVPTSSATLGGESVGVPGWNCGVDIESTCACEPKLYPRNPTCDSPAPLIATNWPDSVVQDPLNPSGYCHIDSQVGCCRYRFNPVKVYETFVDPNGCMSNDELRRRASERVRDFSNRTVADLLIGSTNGNPGLAVHGQQLGGGNPVHPSIALGALHANFNQDGMVVIPWQAISTLLNEGMIHPRVDGTGQLAGYVDAWGYPCILDPGLTGNIGPPATKWDGTTPIDPAADLQTEPAGSGTAWMYITPPVWTGKTEPVSSVQEVEQSQTDPNTLGNFTVGTADSKVIAVFNPCDIYAIKIEVNKAVSCG